MGVGSKYAAEIGTNGDAITERIETMRNKIASGLVGLALAALTTAAQAVPITLDDTIRCGAGNAQNGIAIGDVTGNAGGATDCWGTLDGNDPGPSGDGFDIGGMIFDFIAKEDTPGGLSGADIGLDVNPPGGALSGTWEYDPTLFSTDAFLIVLKASNSPGFGVWLFEGSPDADSSSGTWLVAWGKDLSHLTIYAKNGVAVPEPSTLGLLGAGLLGLAFARRKKVA